MTTKTKQPNCRVVRRGDLVVLLEVPRLFDAHVHFREIPDLLSYVPQTARYCDYALVMPNTDEPISSGEQVISYYQAIKCAAARNGYPNFEPLMTLYLTPEMRAADIIRAKKTAGDRLVGVKLYPKGGTTGSGHGVPADWLHVRNNDTNPMPAYFWDTIQAVAEENLVLNIHGEIPDAFLLARESQFVFTYFMDMFFEKNPGGRLVMEHISTHGGIKAIEKLQRDGFKAAGSITLHHMILTLDDAYRQVHNTCWPAPLYPGDRDQVQGAARLGTPGFFLGSDSAPHKLRKKYQPVCACGCYTAPGLVEMLAEQFAEKSWFDHAGAGPTHAVRMRRFCSQNACEFYGVTEPTETVVLQREPWTMEDKADQTNARPWMAGKEIQFRVVTQ